MSGVFTTLSTPTIYAAQKTHNTVNVCTKCQYMTTFKYAIINYGY